MCNPFFVEYLLLIYFSTQIGIILKKHLNSRSLKRVGVRSSGKIKMRLNTMTVPAHYFSYGYRWIEKETCAKVIP